MTFKMLEERSNQGAHLLRKLGMMQGDHIALLMENRREYLEICFSADRSGLYYTAISVHLPAKDVAYIIQNSGSKLVIVSDIYADMLKSMNDQLPDDLIYILVGGQSSGFISWDQEVDQMPRHQIEDEMQGQDMLYSSGTTGRPKGIKWQQTGERPGSRTMLINLLGGLFGYSNTASYLNPAPLYHAAPLRHSMTTIKLGGSVFIMDRFDAEGALQLIEDEKITHSQWVPTMFVRMLKLPQHVRDKYDVTSMQMAVHAAAPCPVDIKQQMIDWWGPIIHEYYAGTENNGFCVLDTKQWLTHKGSVGTAVLGELHICDESGEELPIGEEGEIYFSGGHDFAYHNDDNATQAVKNKQGWTTLGDIGRVDEDGYLYLTDRKSFMIISGGVNIYPQEIENVILSHPEVADVAVIGVPNEDFGEEVKAIVQPLDLAKSTPGLAQDIQDHCLANLSKISCPRSIDFVETLPRSPTGKLFKRLIRQKYWQN